MEYIILNCKILNFLFNIICSEMYVIVFKILFLFIYLFLGEEMVVFIIIFIYCFILFWCIDLI